MNKIRVLLIDDNEEDISEIKDLLIEASGLGGAEVDRSKPQGIEYLVDVASTYTDAIRSLVQNKYDVYLLDYIIKDSPHNGIELLKRANAGGCVSPVVLMTSLADDDIDLAAEEAGAAGYINKKHDLEPRTLTHIIRYAVCHFRKLQEVQAQLSALQKQLSLISKRLSGR